MKTAYRDIRPFITKDSSEIRELLHPATHGTQNQSLAETASAPSLARGPRLMSLAEAIVRPGDTTALHRHRQTEEIYHITAGQGLMTLALEEFPVTVGDSILIPPGTPHRIRNTGAVPLHILCACAPPYSHEDTELL